MDMRSTRFAYIAACCALLAAGAARAPTQTPAQDPKILEIVKKLDQLYRSKSSHADIVMDIVTPDWSRTLEMEAWSLDTKHTFIRILEPKKERGVATLRIENEMWNYLPKTNKVIKVPPSMMMSSWMGSDLTNDDLVKEFSLYEDYTYSEVHPPDADSGIMYIRAVPRPDLPVVWASIVLAVDREALLPLWDQYYDEKGEKMRRMTYSEVRTFSGRKIPSVMELVPQNKEGHKTVIRYRSLELDLPIDEEIFSLRNLQRGG